MTPETKQCQNCKNSFIIEPEDFEFYKKINVPLPTFCWQCRFQRRIAWRNERRLFRSKSDKSGNPIFSLYPPNSNIKVYSEEEWWADDWDAALYAQDYDFSRPFFSQFAELMRDVPHYSRDVLQMVNSDYCANAGHLKNCYLMFNSNTDEDCAYGNGVDQSQTCFDNSHVISSERCYQSFWLTKCYATYFSVQCLECAGVWFSKNCRGCTDCIGCVNLTKQSHFIFNQQYTKEEYEGLKAEMRLDTWSGVQKVLDKSKEFWQKFPNRYLQGVKNDQVTGEYISHSKNVHYGYLVREGKDLKYVQYLQVPKNEDCYDISIWGQNNEQAYENSVCGLGTFNIKFCFSCWPDVRNLEYCILCKSCSDCFGCVGLRKKQYCIFNKQYSKEEYFQMREKIINQMNTKPYVDKKGRVYKYGEFFPIEISPFGYNISIAIEHFPLTKEQALAEGYSWQEIERTLYQTTIKAAELSDAIGDVSDNILKEIIECSQCKRAYRIIPAELAFLRAEKIPLPRFCVDCRHEFRIASRNKAFLYHRPCQCSGAKSDNGVYQNTVSHFHADGHCPNEFETSYAPDRPEVVYCEKCYQAEVV